MLYLMLQCFLYYCIILLYFHILGLNVEGFKDVEKSLKSIEGKHIGLSFLLE